VARSLEGRLHANSLIAVFGAVALTFSAVGIGVVAFGVARTREFGIRQALAPILDRSAWWWGRAFQAPASGWC
jgi:hypothetical protein